MSFFQNQKFLLKISDQESSYQPKVQVAHQSLYPGFRFFSNYHKGFKIDQQKEEVVLQIGDPQIKGFKLTWNRLTKKVSVITDSLSLYPLLVMPSRDGSLWLSNTTEYFPYVEPDFKLSSFAINHFFTRAYLLPDDFFIEGVKRISKNWQHQIGQPLKVSSCVWEENDFHFYKTQDIHLEETNQFFLSAMRDITTNVLPDEFYFSGGLDSRFLFLTAKKYQLSLPPLRLFQHDSHTHNNYLDFMIAKKFCERESTPHLISPLKNKERSVFSHITDKTVLSGLYGGDILGGCWNSSLPIPIDQAVLRFAFSLKMENELKFSLEKIRKFSEMKKDLLSQQIFTHSDRSLIFGNTNYGWASPLANMRISISPFAISPFLKHIIEIPQVVRKKYQYYYKLYKNLSRNDLFPICSFFTQFAPEFSPDNEYESIQKLSDDSKLQEETKKTEEPKETKDLNRLCEFLISKGIEIDHARFEKNLSRPEFITFCEVINSIFSPFF